MPYKLLWHTLVQVEYAVSLNQIRRVYLSHEYNKMYHRQLIGQQIPCVSAVFETRNGAAETQCGAEVIVFNILNNIRYTQCWQEPCDT